MNLDQHFCLEEISHKFENGSCPVMFTSSNLRKTLLSFRGHIFSLIIMKLGSKIGDVGSKTRSVGQILGKHCERS